MSVTLKEVVFYERNIIWFLSGSEFLPLTYPLAQAVMEMTWSGETRGQAQSAVSALALPSVWST